MDFVIWLLFSREKKSSRWPKNLLCDGYRKQATGADETAKRGQTVPGVFSRYPNQHVKALKESPWTHILTLLGRSGERIMIDLLMDGAMFLPVQTGRGNYYQLSGESESSSGSTPTHSLSGTPISELDPHISETSAVVQHTAKVGATNTKTEKSPSDIVFIRSRMLYARPALNARGLVHPGFKHIRRIVTPFEIKAVANELGRCSEPMPPHFRR